MAKVRQKCQKCNGEGVTLRTTDDPLYKNPFTRRILDTFDYEICSMCWGNRHVMAEVEIVENPAPS